MSAQGQKRKCARSRGMSVRPSGADIVRLHAQVRFVPFAIFCKIQHIIRSSGRRCHRGPYPRPIAEVSSGSAINITPEVIDHGHRPRPHRRCCSCLIISRGVTTGCAPWNSFTRGSPHSNNLLGKEPRQIESFLSSKSSNVSRAAS